MSIDAVRALLDRGVSRPTLYEVIVNFPRGIAAQETQRQLQFLCSKTAVPPASINTILALGHESQGVTREQPTVVTFNSPFQISVISDRDYSVYKDIKLWYDRIAFNANPGVRGGQSQKMEYYNEPGAGFARTIELRKLELQGGQGTREPGSFAEPFRIIFNNAFPVRIGEITLDSAGTDTAVEFTVDFAYETYNFNPEPGQE